MTHILDIFLTTANDGGTNVMLGKLLFRGEIVLSDISIKS